MHIITKGEYAKHRGVTPGAVSQWIANRKISGAALVGVGRLARINVEVADRQLAATLDMGQQLARGGHVQPTPAPSAGPLFSAANTSHPPVGGEGDGDGEDIPTDDSVARYNRARAAQKELELRQAIEKDLAARGTYMLTSDARAAFGRELRVVIQTIEQWLPDVAAALATEMGRRAAEAKEAGAGPPPPMSGREVGVLLTKEWRALRGRMSEQAAARKAQAAPLVEVPLVPEEEASGTD